MTDLSLPAVTLVLGGARSGKSRHAESLAEARPGDCVYLATAEPLDGEMAARIRAHRARRGERWRTVEAPLELPGALREAAGRDRVVLVDCLTLWLSNLLGAGRDPAVATEDLVTALTGLAGPVVLVSNEVGQGVVPDNALARAFIDHAGRLHQAVAVAAQSVIVMVAGLPLQVKPRI
jgi:adenosylcobinamide kinase/adenosylcobinamide-phosphate guanylyltransferase